MNEPIGLETQFGATYVCNDELLRQSDIVTLHIPATSETFHYIDEREFKLMKRSAFLINAARGQVVNENLLLKALENKQIAGAAIDVYKKEPHVSDKLKKWLMRF